MDDRERVIDIFNAALAAVDPYCAVMAQEEAVLGRYGKGGFTALYVIGFGKAAPAMVRAVLDAAGDRVSGGIAVTKYGHWLDSLRGPIRAYEAGHPIPDENGVRATTEAMTLPVASTKGVSSSASSRAEARPFWLLRRQASFLLKNSGQLICSSVPAPTLSSSTQ